MLVVSERQEQVIEVFLKVLQAEKNVKNVTVKKLAERIGISRQALYAKHFESIEDILDKIHSIVDEEAVKKIQVFVSTGQGDPLDFFGRDILPLLYQRRDWLKVLYQYALDSSWLEYLVEIYSPLIQVYIERQGNQTGLSDDFLCTLIVSQILTVIAQWLSSDSPEPASIFQKKFNFILKQSTYDLLAVKTA